MEIPKDTSGLPSCLMNLSLDPEGLDGTLHSQKLSLTRPIPDPPKKSHSQGHFAVAMQRHQSQTTLHGDSNGANPV